MLSRLLDLDNETKAVEGIGIVDIFTRVVNGMLDIFYTIESNQLFIWCYFVLYFMTHSKIVWIISCDYAFILVDKFDVVDVITIIITCFD